MKPERDPDLCAWGDCPAGADVATPAGPLCHRHAEEYAEEIL